MGTIRNGARTRQRIFDAAAAEFAARGYDAATVAGIARRARVSKQLVHHHFGSKERLFQELHDERFRPGPELRELPPADPASLFADRYEKHVGDRDYIRFQTWEAARGRTRALPGEATRQQRIARYGAALRATQKQGMLPADLDPRLVQLAAYALSTYPMAFDQITRLVTGRSSTDPVFQREWRRFLRILGRRLFANVPG